MENNNIKYPRILVISNNPFSNITNNGKTLASFFTEFPSENIYQLYFSSELPDNTHYKNYFKISDDDIIKSILKRNDICGEIIDYKTLKQIKINQNNKNSFDTFIKSIKKYNILRIIREMLWLSKRWNTELLSQWVKEISPEIIFLCAGDSGFAYDITKYIQEISGAKLVVYITDDYVLPRKTLSPFWWIRRNYILNKMKYTVQRSDLFITISQKMRVEYRKLFGKDSILAMNMTESMKDDTITVDNKTILTLVYAGGLHYNRYKTLNLLAKLLKRYNHEFGGNRKAYLKIYSSQKLNRKMLKYLNIEGASEFCGKLNSKQLKETLNSCDILVHVESFDKKSIEATRLSISTKIPEYLSLGKPILAIGPEQIASMEFLEDSAFCITDQHNIYFKLIRLLNDTKLHNELSKKALVKFNSNSLKEKTIGKLMKSILDIYK